MVWGIAACGGDETTETTVAPDGTETTSAPDSSDSTTETSAPGEPTKTEELKIGASIPLSGPPSAAGIAFKAGWEMAFDEVNAAGGIVIGDTAYTIKFMAEDSEASAEGGTTAATKLCLQEGVKFLMGDIADFMVPPIYDVTSEAGTLFFVSLPINAADIPGNIAVPAPDKPLLIWSMPSSSQLDLVCPNYLVENYPDAKKIALLALDFPEYDAYKEVMTEKLAPLGLEVTGYERVATDAVDFVPVTTRMLEGKPDVIYLLRSAMSQFPMIIKTARDQGFTGPIMYSTPTDIAYAALAGDNVTDVFGTGLCMDDDDLPASVKDPIAAGRAKYGDQFVSDSILAYDQAKLLVQMIEKAQSIDPEVVQSTFETLTNAGDLTSIFGPAYAGGEETDGVNHVLVKPWPLSRMTDGVPEHVDFITIDVP
jgi:branched-chain amino acid transport system substrate-binding protein